MEPIKCADSHAVVLCIHLFLNNNLLLKSHYTNQSKQQSCIAHEKAPAATPGSQMHHKDFFQAIICLSNAPKALLPFVNLPSREAKAWGLPVIDTLDTFLL